MIKINGDAVEVEGSRLGLVQEFSSLCASFVEYDFFSWEIVEVAIEIAKATVEGDEEKGKEMREKMFEAFFDYTSLAFEKENERSGLDGK